MKGPRARNVAAADKAQRALELRIQGASYEQIAKIVGYANRGNAHRAVESLQKSRAAEGVDQLRAIGLQRYENVIRQATVVLNETRIEKVVSDTGVQDKHVPAHSTRDRLNAAQTILRSQEQINRLFGLNMEAPPVETRTNTVIVEAETLTGNMVRALSPTAYPQSEDAEDDDEILDVVVDED